MHINRITLALLLLSMASCGAIMDDLAPSGLDKRGSGGKLAPGQRAPDFSMPDIHGNMRTLSGELAGNRGAVIYFSMWCPVCDSHMQSILHGPLPKNPDVAFLVVDYVTSVVDGASKSATEAGYADGPFIILVDTTGQPTLAYGGTMGTTVVVDRTGVVRWIGDYKGEAELEKALAIL